MHRANPTWGAPRIHGELLKLGFTLAQSTVSKYLPRQRKPPSQGWRTFLRNHLGEAIAIDFAVVPTMIFRLLFVFVVLGLDRRKLLHVNETAHPTAEWTARQMVQALPWETTARYVIRDRDRIDGVGFRRRVAGLGLHEVPIAPRSPWQNAYAERFIGSLRRECLDHMIVLSERHLHRILSDYARYYNGSRTHLALGKDAPEPRLVHRQELGEVVAFAEVGGLHHRYERRAARRWRMRFSEGTGIRWMMRCRSISRHGSTRRSERGSVIETLNDEVPGMCSRSIALVAALALIGSSAIASAGTVTTPPISRSDSLSQRLGCFVSNPGKKVIGSFTITLVGPGGTSIAQGTIDDLSPSGIATLLVSDAALGGNTTGACVVDGKGISKKKVRVTLCVIGATTNDCQAAVAAQ